MSLIQHPPPAPRVSVRVFALNSGGGDAGLLLLLLLLLLVLGVELRTFLMSDKCSTIMLYSLTLLLILR